MHSDVVFVPDVLAHSITIFGTVLYKEAVKKSYQCAWSHQCRLEKAGLNVIFLPSQG